MSKRDCSLYVVDILIAINKIERYTESFSTAQELLHSELQWDASIRELQLIGDAVNELIKLELLDRSYRRVVDFRNQIVHAYFGIDEDIVWSVIHHKLPQISDNLLHTAHNKGISLIPAIESSLVENSVNNSVRLFLESLLKRITTTE